VIRDSKNQAGVTPSVLAVMLALVACGTGSERVTTASGAQGVKIKCKGDRANCLADAGDACPNGFHIVSEDSHSGGALADVLPGPVPWWTMIIQCGPAPVGYVPPPKAPPRTTPVENPFSPPSTVTTAPRCTSDYQCAYGARCTKDSFATYGVCARVVNEYGTPTYSPPDPGSYRTGEGQCSFDTECPIGFRCIKTSGGLRGNCMK
jgi:hypothetical protein